MEENIIKIIDGLYITSSNIENDRYKYIININNKTIDNVHESTIDTHCVNIYIEEILLSSSITGIDYNTVNNFILDAFKNKEKVIIYDDSNYIVSFLICSIFMIKIIKTNYFDTIAWLKYKLKINSKIYKKLSYQLLLHTQ
jgi:hypothetical protein